MQRRNKKVKTKIISVILALFVICGIFVACGVQEKTDIATNTDATEVIEEITEVTEKAPVTITNVSFGENYDGAKTIVIEYNWTNLSDDSASFDLEFTDAVYQNGLECEKAYVADDTSNDISAKIRPGASITFTQAYMIREENVDFEVEVTKWLFSDNICLNQTITYDSIAAG